MPRIVRDKRIARMIMCLSVIHDNVAHHIKVWGDEIKLNDGWLAPHKKGLMTKMYNSIEKMLMNYDENHVVLSNGARENLLDKIYEFHVILANRKAKEGVKKTFDFDIEKKSMPNGMLDTFIAFSLTTEYTEEYFSKSLEIENLTDDFKKFKKYLKQYQKFFEDEMIITVREG